MKIEEHIIDHWMAKLSASKPVLMIYDPEKRYYSLLPMLQSKGVDVVDTTKNILEAHEKAVELWCNSSLGTDDGARLAIYRGIPMPKSKKEWVNNEPYAGFKGSSNLFPYGPEDDYKTMCMSFMPSKKKELEDLFSKDTTDFVLVNSLLEGASFPNLEQFASGKSATEIVLGLLSKPSNTVDMVWSDEWHRYAKIQFPGLDATGVTVKEIQTKLWAYLLFSEFVFDLPDCKPENLPDSLKTVPLAPITMQDKVYTICDKLRKNVDLRETYIQAAPKIASQLDLATMYGTAKHLGQRVTFNFENKVEYNRFVDYLKQNNMQEAHTMYEKNIRDVWYQADSEVKAFWDISKQAIDLFDCINNGIKSDGTLQELVKWYENSGYKADKAFRLFHTYRQRYSSFPQQADEIEKILNSKYLEFVQRGVKAYQSKIKELKTYPVLKNQACPQVVYPALAQGKRVALFMIDALRYEMGRTFADNLKTKYDDRTDCKIKVSFLPSITRFGMANHLGDISIVKDSDKLQPSLQCSIIETPEDRINYLKAKTNVEVQDIRLQDLKPEAINDTTRLLVVRSTNIDTAGEQLTHFGGLVSMYQEITLLAKATDICRDKKFDLAVYAADHGYMLIPEFNVGNLIDKPAGSSVMINESRLIAGNVNNSADTLTFNPQDLGLEADVMKLSYAKEFTVFSQGEVYFHEGLSLQENIVPMVTIQLQEKTQTRNADLKLSYNRDKIYTLRPLISIALYDSLFSSDYNIKLLVTDGNNIPVGMPEGGKYNEITGCVCIKPTETAFRQPILINDDYTGNKIVVKAIDEATGKLLDKLELEYEIE